MSLPQGLNLVQTQNTWATQLNPLISNPLSKAIILENVTLTTGDNVINHRLGRKLRGFYITRMRNAFSQIYDTQDQNPTPQLTLNLNSSTDIVVDLVVY